MRTLEAVEVRRLSPIIEATRATALLSPCQKSKRGAAVFRTSPGYYELLGLDYNKPGTGRYCNPEFCRKVCNLFTVHAERGACQEALAAGFDLNGASVLHLKVVNGILQTSDDLSCADCSNYMTNEMATRNIRLKEMVLLQSRGYVAYDVEEFHKLTLAYLKRC